MVRGDFEASVWGVPGRVGWIARGCPSGARYNVLEAGVATFEQEVLMQSALTDARFHEDGGFTIRPELFLQLGGRIMDRHAVPGRRIT